MISSRKAIVCDRSPSSCSKSWKCFDTQCLTIIEIMFGRCQQESFSYLKTFRTLIVAGELTTDSFLFLAASTSGGSSLGFDDADVAIRKGCMFKYNQLHLGISFSYLSQTQLQLSKCYSCSDASDKKYEIF